MVMATLRSDGTHFNHFYCVVAAAAGTTSTTLLSSICSAFFFLDSNFIYILLSIATYYFIYPPSFLLLFSPNTYSLGFCTNVLFLDGTNCRKKRVSIPIFYRTNLPIRMYNHGLYILHLLFASMRSTTNATHIEKHNL